MIVTILTVSPSGEHDRSDWTDLLRLVRPTVAHFRHSQDSADTVCQIGSAAASRTGASRAFPLPSSHLVLLISRSRSTESFASCHAETLRDRAALCRAAPGRACATPDVRPITDVLTRMWLTDRVELVAAYRNPGRFSYPKSGFCFPLGSSHPQLRFCRAIPHDC
jgi:hypothetical protein